MPTFEFGLLDHIPVPVLLQGHGGVFLLLEKQHIPTIFHTSYQDL